MKVVFVTQSYHPRPGGVTEHVHHAAEELRGRGHHVTVLTAGFGGGADNDPEVIRLGTNVLVPVNGAWVNMTVGRNLYGRLKRWLHALNPDVIHTHCPLAPTLPLLTLLAAPRSARVVGTFHAAADGILGFQAFGPILRRLARRLDARIAVSQAALALAQRYFPGDYTVIPNGIDCTRFSPSVEPLPELRDGAFNVLFVGRLDKRKGLKHLFRAISMASRQARVPMRLILVGDDGIRRLLLPRTPRNVELVLTGVVPKEVLPRYFASGDVFCSPATERESFGIVLLEAMAAGLPVIATGIPGYLTVLKHRWNSLVAPPRDPEALSRGILELMGDEGLRRRLCENGLRFARRYRWNRIVVEIEKLYEQTLGAGWEPFTADESALETPIGA